MVLNIAAYRFAAIEQPAQLAAQLRARAQQASLLGSILVAEEGINLFLAGSEADIGSFLARLQADSRFAGMPVKYSRSGSQPFARLKVKHKREIIAFRQSDASPLQERAPSVSATALARWIAQGCDDGGRPLRLLDTRNREETGHGSFRGAIFLPIDNFADLPAAVMAQRNQLSEATVVSFCTGGIRCEKAALWLRAQGIDALQLEGGILGYFEQVGGYGYEGNCFVFDGRIALDPALTPLADCAGR